MESSDLILYSYYRSSCSYRVRIAMNLLGLSYEYRPIHLVREGGEQLKNDYLALNPKGEVPLLIHGKTKMTQSMAIINYLDQLSQNHSLFPQDPTSKAKTIELCEIINSGIQPIQNLKVMKTLVKQFKVSDEQKKQWSQFFITEGFKALEYQLTKTGERFCSGDQPSAADCFLVPQVYNAHRFSVDMSLFPQIDRINQQCLKLPAFIQASPEKQIDAPVENI